MLERGDEGQADALPERHRFRRIGVRRNRARVGHGLEPVRPRHRFQRVVRCTRSTRLDRARPPRAVGKQIEAHVGRDAVQPGTQRSAAVEPVEAAPGTNDGLLDRVVGVDRRSHHPVTVAGEGLPMLF